VFNPPLDLAQRCGVEGVEPGPRHLPLPHQAGAPQDSEMPGDGWTADRKEARQLSGGALPLTQGVEDTAPGWIRDGVKGEAIVCNHIVT